MRAVIVDRWMDPSELRVAAAPEPEPSDGEVLIEARAAGCNFFDTLLVRGKYQVKPPFPFSPGGEVSGVIRALGRDARGFSEGDRVMAHVGDGAFAELVRAPVRSTYRIPAGMSFEDAAGFPIVCGTAYAAVVVRGRAQPSDTVLITAASGGVGLACIRVSKALGCRVIALSSRDKLSVAREAGADVAIDYGSDGWADDVRHHTGGRGADVIIENVGGDIFEGCMKCIAWAGRLVVCGFASGRIPEVRLNRVLLKHIALVGVHYGPMFEQEPDTLRNAFKQMFDWYERGVLSPGVSKVYPLEEVAEALVALGDRRTTGKIVLRI